MHFERAPQFTTIERLPEPGRSWVSRLIYNRMTFARMREGQETFASTRAEAAAHEAGHCIIATVAGWGVTQSQIRRGHMDMQNFGVETWGGLTNYRKQPPHVWPSSPAEDDLCLAREYLAGWMGEHFPLPGSRPARLGSSLDEQALAYYVCQCVSFKCGADPTRLLLRQIEVVHQVIEHNRDLHREIALLLMRRSTVSGEKIERVTNRVVVPDGLLERAFTPDLREPAREREMMLLAIETMTPANQREDARARIPANA